MDAPRDRDDPRLAACCGAYCGACLAFHGEIAGEAEALLGRIRRQGFLELARRLEPSEGRAVDAFYDVLDRIARTPACPGCGRGGGVAGCPVRRCCRDRGQQTCAACDERPACAGGDRSAPPRPAAAERSRLREDGSRPMPFSPSEFLARLTRKYGGWNLANLDRQAAVGLAAWLVELAADLDFRSSAVKEPADVWSDDDPDG